MLIALFLLYRIAYPKRTDGKKKPVHSNLEYTAASAGVVPERETQPARSVMGKSSFVLSDRRKPLQTTATLIDAEPKVDKEITFAPEKRPAIIPPDELDKFFEDEPNPEDLDIDDDDGDDDDEIDIDIEDEETERFGHEAMLADGLDFDDLTHVAEIVREQPETVSRETGAKMVALEHTDMFEALASGNEGKMNWIKSVIERHVQDSLPETETESDVSESDNSNFDTSYFVQSTSIADFLGRNIKR